MELEAAPKWSLCITKKYSMARHLCWANKGGLSFLARRIPKLAIS